MNVESRTQAHEYLKDTTITVRSMDINHMIVDPRLNGHQISRQG